MPELELSVVAGASLMPGQLQTYQSSLSQKTHGLPSANDPRAEAQQQLTNDFNLPKSQTPTSGPLLKDAERRILQHSSTLVLPPEQKTAGRRVACPLCDKTFARKCYVKRHARKHDETLAESFKCPFPACNNKGFPRKDKLRDHLEGKHGAK